jgi:hemerythrin
MDPFAFTDDLLTGMDDIDAQHRMLFEFANQTVDPSTQRGADASFFASLAFLAEYVEYHFAAEALAMQRSDYPARAGHLSAHASFRQRIAAMLEASLETSDITSLRLELRDAISVWLAQHVRTADKAFAEFLRQQENHDLGLPDADDLVEAGLVEKRISWSELRAAIDTPES